VRASKDIWELFERREIEAIVDSDMTSAICFLTGVCSGSICVIVVAAWTYTVHQSYTATISLLAAFIGYLMVCQLNQSMTDLYIILRMRFNFM
jgi:hypothetical protein